MAEKEVRKTTAKKTVRRTASKTVPARTAVRKTAAPSPVRKAPSRVAIETRSQKIPKLFFAGLFIFFIMLGVSAVIGFSDAGQLNVESSIALRKQNASPEEQEALKSVPVQQTQNAAPNGGLIGMGESEVPPPPPEVVASTTASTTEAAASSTEPVSDSEAQPTSEDTTLEESHDEAANPVPEEVPAI